MSGGLASKGLSTGFVMDAVWEGRVHAGGRLVNGAGIWVNGLCRGLADGNGCPLWEGRVHAGGLPTDSVADSRTGTDVRFGWERVHAGGRITLNLTCLRESMIDRGSSPRERAG